MYGSMANHNNICLTYYFHVVPISCNCNCTMPHQRGRNGNRSNLFPAQHNDMQRFAIRFSFDGTTFKGFQSQPYQNTVQDQLEHRLKGLLKRHVRIIAWGRTDAGVHAQNAVATIDLTAAEVQRFAKMTGSELDEGETNEAKAARFLHSVLTEFSCNTGYIGPNSQERYGSIVSKAVIPVQGDFDARYSALWKRYVYFVCSGNFCDPSPFAWTRYAWKVRETLDVKAMEEAAKLLSSKEHNFSWMSVTQEGELRDQRRLVTLTVEKISTHINSDDSPYFLRGPANIYMITGTCDFFLYKMMRRIVGILVAIGQHKSDIDTLTKYTDAFDDDEHDNKMIVPNELLQTAPAKGLCLDHIEYGIPI